MSLSRVKLKELANFFKSVPLIKLVYLFGSHARGSADKFSDFDFAIYVDTLDRELASDLLLKMLAKIPLILSTDKVDVVMLNLIDNLILKNNIIMEGKLIFEVPGYRLNYELPTLGEYRDFRIMEKQYYSD